MRRSGTIIVREKGKVQSASRRLDVFMFVEFLVASGEQNLTPCLPSMELPFGNMNIARG